MVYTLSINGETHEVDVDGNTPLLWVLRDHLAMTGTKFGCGIMQCGACTVQLDGVATRSCTYPVQQVGNQEITTIEGLAKDETSLLQEVWVRNNVPQCGYCQSGMLMAASSLLKSNPNPTDEDIENEVSNFCRCGTYPRVKAAIKEVAAELNGQGA